MEAVEALHTAARRYCIDRAATWERHYSDLRDDEELARRRAGIPEPTTYSYSDRALDTFPRYQILYAIQAAVEAFRPAEFGSLGEARELLAAAGTSAESVFTQPPHGETEKRALDEERELFARYLQDITEVELADVEALPFRRTLTAAESKALWAELETRWGVTSHYWYPLDRAPDEAPPPDTAAFDSEPFVDAHGQEHLRQVLSGLGVTRLWELRELDTDADTEIELALLEPVYTGAEGLWTDLSFEWLVYASHEGSVTVAGRRLLPDLQAVWADWADHLYGGSLLGP